MFTAGDTVLYGVNGVCKIEEVAQRTFGGVRGEYYVLSPVAGGGRVYVPTDSEKLISRMHRVLSLEEVLETVRVTEPAALNWESDNERKGVYKEATERSEPAALIGMVKAVALRKDELAGVGKKLHLCDERFLEGAVKVLHGQFSLVMDIKREDVLGKILER